MIQPSDFSADADPNVRFGGFVSCAPKMRAALHALERLSQSDACLLVEGETGVGKELAAEAVHRASARRDGPFLVFDCAEKSLEAGEYELFGAETRGAPEPVMPGVFELGAGGTVFLDHVDELAAPLQSKLLRAIERRQIRRAGGASVDIDVRVIAACVGGLRRAVRLGHFGQDLQALLSCEIVRVPPLRERREDIGLLAAQFLAECKPARTLGDIPDPVWAAFRSHRWPGNVRELRNALQRALIVPDRALGFTRSA